MKRLELNQKQMGLSEVIAGSLTSVVAAGGMGYLALRSAAENIYSREADIAAMLGSMDPQAMGKCAVAALGGYFVQQVGVRRMELVEERASR